MQMRVKLTKKSRQGSDALRASSDAGKASRRAAPAARCLEIALVPCCLCRCASQAIQVYGLCEVSPRLMNDRGL